jgi:pyridoxamine 5'-phosphate oxidase
MSKPNDWTTGDPIETFNGWLREADESEPNDPNAAALATSTVTGRPSVRMVLVKRVDQRGFCFFSNAESRKGNDLAANASAALCFHWKSLRRQVRVTGSVTELDAAAVDEYFHSRSRRSQIGAAVSAQSRPLQSREALEEEVRRFEQSHPSEIPRPAYWRGYCIRPEEIELWQDGPDRLHNRFLFTPGDNGWNSVRLYP